MSTPTEQEEPPVPVPVPVPLSAEGLPGIAWILEPSRLHAVFTDSQVLPGDGGLRTSYLRYKPGFTAVARLDALNGQGKPTGEVRWVAAYAPAAGEKLNKTRQKARELYGQRAQSWVEVYEVPGYAGHLLAVGHVATDAKLAGALKRILGPAAAGLGRVGGDLPVLRYNPHRRVVLEMAQETGTAAVVKVTADPHPVPSGALQELAERGLRVQTAMPCPESAVTADARVRCYPWFGDGDLSARRCGQVSSAAHAAGIALADLHHAADRDVLRGAHDGAERPSALRHAAWGSGSSTRAGSGRQLPEPVDPGARLAAMASDLRAIDDHVAASFERMAERVEARLGHSQDQRGIHAVVLHGDFSADQVLVDGTALGESPVLESVLIADLDRLRWGEAADDLGNLVSAQILAQTTALVSGRSADQREISARPIALSESDLTHCVLAGYRQRTSQLGVATPRDADIRAWAAFHLLMRVMTPFRDCARDWTGRMRRILDAAGALIPDFVPMSLTADGQRMQVKRAWPKPDGRLSAELTDSRGRIRAAVGTPNPELLGAMTWKVSAFGQDPKLPALERLVSDVPAADRTHGTAGESDPVDTGATLVVHRRGRRAVVALPDRYVKLVAGAKAAEVARLSKRLHQVGTAAGFTVPSVLFPTEDGHLPTDRVEFGVVPGSSLHELGARDDAAAYRAGLAAWAQRWPALVRSPVTPGQLPPYTAEDEARTLTDWAERLAAFPGVLPVPSTDWQAAVERTTQELKALTPQKECQQGVGASESTAVTGVLHRDLHEKQLLVHPLGDGRAQIGLLDFDTAAVGDPALDLANLRVHLELHRRQGLLSAELYATACDHVDEVAGDLAVSAHHLSAYQRATRLRLACVYAFRPRWRDLVARWAAELLD